jgi:CRP-like cAMP-binding protein
LSDRSEADWRSLLAYTETRRFHAGDCLINRGETERALYIITEGSLEVLVPRGGKGRPHQVAVIEAGSVFGEQAFLDGQARSATVRARTDGELSRLSLESFEALAGREPALARAILFDLGRVLSQRLRRATGSIAAWMG